MAHHSANMDFLNSETVDKLLKWSELIPAIEQALVNFSGKEQGGVIQPVRITMPIENHKGILLLMPCYTRYEDVLACKIFTGYEGNPQKGLPVYNGLVFLFDAETGLQKAIMDAEPITAKRTAAATAAAIKAVLNKDPKVLTILGAGVQARSHFQVMTHLYKFQEIRLWNRTLAKAQVLAREMRDSGFPATVYSTAAEAARDSNLIISTTGSHTPILKAEWVDQDSVIAVVGGNRPTHQEVDPFLIKNSTIYVDSIEAAFKESGDIILNNAEIEGEIGELISGQKMVKRGKPIVLKTMGLAVEDAVSAKLVYKNFLENKKSKNKL